MLLQPSQLLRGGGFVCGKLGNDGLTSHGLLRGLLQQITLRREIALGLRQIRLRLAQFGTTPVELLVEFQQFCTAFRALLGFGLLRFGLQCGKTLHFLIGVADLLLQPSQFLRGGGFVCGELGNDGFTHCGLFRGLLQQISMRGEIALGLRQIRLSLAQFHTASVELLVEF